MSSKYKMICRLNSDILADIPHLPLDNASIIHKGACAVVVRFQLVDLVLEYNTEATLFLVF